MKIADIEVVFGVKPKNAPATAKQQAIDELAAEAARYDRWQEQLRADPTVENPFADLEEDMIDGE